LEIDETADRKQRELLSALRRRRSSTRVQAALDAVRRAAESRENTMPSLLDAVRSYATVGEICDALRDVFGTYQEPNVV
ncbi:MAG: methylmalonyl-CoA mutase, partial [Bryobacteraceae bacterium]|nr:methylmalonyl-CoA mutase [Bryobacteraceae bacterium]